ncbi:MAG: HAD family hydrolase [Opitutales bacterium]|nr:HAD family hydrolase [Opitutales bacterium]
MDATDFSDIEHIVWDWNGTLVDDAWLCVEVVNEILADEGRPAITLASYRDQFDFPVVRYYERLGLPIDPAGFDRISVRFIETYHERVEQCRLREGIEAVLPALRQAGLGFSILSASRQDHLDKEVARYGLGDFFESLNGIETIHATGKVARGRSWLASQTSAPERILLVGDTVHDFEVARALGIRCALLADGHHATARLEATGAPVLPGAAALLPHFAARFD